MKCSALWYNFFVNPFNSHAADALCIQYLSNHNTTNLDTSHVERYILYYW